MTWVNRKTDSVILVRQLLSPYDIAEQKDSVILVRQLLTPYGMGEQKDRQCDPSVAVTKSL